QPDCAPGCCSRSTTSCCSRWRLVSSRLSRRWCGWPWGVRRSSACRWRSRWAGAAAGQTPRTEDRAWCARPGSGLGGAARLPIARRRRAAGGPAARDAGVMEVRLRGLDGPVELIRDRWGVPHCRAVTEHDAFFAQGVAHALDRLWQMDYDRRRGLGRWAEEIGPTAVAGDALYRRLDLAASARSDVARLSVTARDMLTAYAAGVNAVMARQFGARGFGGGR